MDQRLISTQYSANTALTQESFQPANRLGGPLRHTARSADLQAIRTHQRESSASNAVQTLTQGRFSQSTEWHVPAPHGAQRNPAYTATDSSKHIKIKGGQQAGDNSLLQVAGEPQMAHQSNGSDGYLSPAV
jgi:hypothetical protein